MAYSRNGSTRLSDQVRALLDEATLWRSEASDIASEGQRLMRMQLELAQAEAQEARQHATMAAGFGSGAALLAGLTTVFLSLALMFALDTALPLWASALITAAVAALLGAALALLAKQQISRFSPVPRRFIRSLGEDAQWARSQIKSRMR